MNNPNDYNTGRITDVMVTHIVSPQAPVKTTSHPYPATPPSTTPKGAK